MRLEALRHPVCVTLRLQLVMLEGVEDLRIIRRGDHPVEHAQDVLLHRVRLVDVLDQLLLQLSHRVQPPHRELTELAAEQRRPPEVGAVPGLELVDEQTQRVVQLQDAHFEPDARNVRKFRCPT